MSTTTVTVHMTTKFKEKITRTCTLAEYREVYEMWLTGQANGALPVVMLGGESLVLAGVEYMPPPPVM